MTLKRLIVWQKRATTAMAKARAASEVSFVPKLGQTNSIIPEIS